LKDARSASLSGTQRGRTVLKIDRPFDTPVGVRVQRVQKVQRVQRGRYRPAGDEYEVSVTFFSVVSSVLHDKEPEPPSLGRNPAEDF